MDSTGAVSYTHLDVYKRQLPRSPEQDAHFVDADYAIPAELLGGKRKVTVRFQATDGNEIRGIFGVRTVRAGEAR